MCWGRFGSSRHTCEDVDHGLQRSGRARRYTGRTAAVHGLAAHQTVQVQQTAVRCTCCISLDYAKESFYGAFNAVFIYSKVRRVASENVVV